MLTRETGSAKQLAKIAGTLSSMHASLGKIVRLFTRKMYAQIEGRQSWSTTEPLTEGSTTELQFWHQNITKLNGCSFKPRNTTTEMVFTDASDIGYGGFMVTRLVQHICTGRFSVLQSYGELLRHQAIQINIDNQAAARILSIGSTKEHLQKTSLDIFHYCVKHDIKLTPEWVPREDNRDADYFSRIQDSDSWGIDDESFETIQKRFGPFEVDRFADDKNKRLEIFNSKYYCPGTAHVNSFTADWRGKNNWLSPPVKDIISTIKHLELCKGHGTLLIPCWPSAIWWPLIYPDGKCIAGFVKGMLVLDPFYTSYSDNSTVFRGFQRFKTLALKVDFTT